SRILTIDGLGAIIGGATGASANTVVVESAAGVGEGARTGLASLVTGALFAGAMFLTPLAAVVPSQAAAPALVLVRAVLMTASRPQDRLERPGPGDPRLPHDRAHAVHVLDHQRRRRGDRGVHADQGGQAELGRDPLAALGDQRRLPRLLRHRRAQLTFTPPLH